MKSECQFFFDRLEQFLDGKLAEEELRATEAHLRDCARCAELARIADENERELPFEAPPGLAEAILGRTSGSTCDSARDRLCDYVDGQLEATDYGLVRQHLEGCPDCSLITGALSALAAELPALIEIEPDDRFVEAVLARTLPRRSRSARWAARLSVGWQKLLQRPRLAWEGAYVCSMVLAVLFLAPGAPFAELPRKALELIRAEPAQTLKRAATPIDAQLSVATHTAWQETGGRTLEALREFTTGVGQVSAATGREIERGVGTLSRRLASIQETNNTDRPDDSEGRTQGDEP